MPQHPFSCRKFIDRLGLHFQFVGTLAPLNSTLYGSCVWCFFFFFCAFCVLHFVWGFTAAVARQRSTKVAYLWGWLLFFVSGAEANTSWVQTRKTPPMQSYVNRGYICFQVFLYWYICRWSSLLFVKQHITNKSCKSMQMIFIQVTYLLQIFTNSIGILK